MQVIADTIKNADAVLSEMLTLTDTAFSMAKAAAPIQELMKQSTTRKSPPVLAAESGKVLKENFIEDFRSLFPNVSSGVTNGRMGTASYRLHDGVYPRDGDVDMPMLCQGLPELRTPRLPLPAPVQEPRHRLVLLPRYRRQTHFHVQAL